MGIERPASGAGLTLQILAKVPAFLKFSMRPQRALLARAVMPQESQLRLDLLILALSLEAIRDPKRSLLGVLNCIPAVSAYPASRGFVATQSALGLVFNSLG